MTTMIKITTPITKDMIKTLHVGDILAITGTIYTGRDAAHKKLVTLIQENKPLPFDLTDSILYYVGPTPAKPGKPIGSAGPTSSYRMDSYTPYLLAQGSLISIGKGPRSQAIKEALVNYQGLYLSAIGGTAALTADSIKKCELIAYPELGAEAIYKLEVVDFFAVVTYDSYGHDLLETGISTYQIK